MTKKEINNYLHRFSKYAGVQGQLHQTQAQFRSGHNVDYCTVRGQDIPQCRHRQLLLTPQGNVKGIFTDRIKFWNKARMTLREQTNGQVYYLKDGAGQVISDFIDPSDKLIDGRQLSRGYTQFFYGKKAGSEQFIKISPNNYQFQAYSGILSFYKGKTPEDLGFQQIYIQAFQYIGKNVKQDFRDVKQLIAMNLMLMQQINARQIVVQPYTFSTANMRTVWQTPRPIPGSFNRFGKQMWCQRFSIIIPGYVFQVNQINGSSSLDFEDTSLDSKSTGSKHMAIRQNGVIIPDMHHIQDGINAGSTQIQIQLQVNAGDQIQDTGDGKCIIGYYQQTDVISGNKVLKIQTGDIMFTASTFKQNDNKKIQVKPVIPMEGQGDTLMQISPQLKHRLLVQQYQVQFTPASVQTKSTELLDSLYDRKSE